MYTCCMGRSFFDRAITCYNLCGSLAGFRNASCHLARLLRRQLPDHARLPRPAGHFDDPSSLGARLQTGLLAGPQGRVRCSKRHLSGFTRFRGGILHEVAQPRLGEDLALAAVVAQALLGVAGDLATAESPERALRSLYMSAGEHDELSLMRWDLSFPIFGNPSNV